MIHQCSTFKSNSKLKALFPLLRSPGSPLSRGRWVFFGVFFFICLAGCANSHGESQEYRAPATNAPEVQLAPKWKELAARLAKDGVAGPEVDALLASLNPVPTQAPMGRKISELYKKQFYPKSGKATGKQKYYKGVVTAANAELCRQFIAEHQSAFDAAWKNYGVPPAIGSALLFVETRLGKVLGDVPENAFYTLASMAVSTTPEDISDWLPKLKDSSQHLGWIEETMRKRSEWAFNETAALLKHMIKDKIPPSRLPGSIYGAVGLCQFMPSNISPYGADGDNDGRIDLFNAPDAIASLSNYLYRHGWKTNMSRERQHEILMTYNHANIYANTILALADLIVHKAPSAK